MHWLSKSLFISGLLLALVFSLAAVSSLNTVRNFEVPKAWPKPSYDFEKSPLTEEGIVLGRKLFYDPILSRNNTVSCASCHLSYTAFTHVDHDLSHGIEDRIGNRNSLALMNLAWSTSFMWDGAVNHLDMQALAPISHPAEMDEKLENIVIKLSKSNDYLSRFKMAFGDTLITGQRVLKSLAQFQLTLVSANSKYDKVTRGEVSFSPQEQKGYALFKQKCASCHQEPLFSKHGFENNGLPIDSTLNDSGRVKISLNAKDYLKFKVPTLRNIEFSFPYMHDGRFDNLSEVLNHYQSGIVKSETLADELKVNLELSSNNKVDLIAFLLTLSDKEFLFNQEHAFPRE